MARARPLSSPKPPPFCIRRYGNPPAAELTNAAVEQQKITELRLRKLFGGADPAAAPAAQDAQDRRAGRLLAQLAPAAGAALPTAALPCPALQTNAL